MSRKLPNFEQTGDGRIYVPSQNLLLGGVFDFTVNGELVHQDLHNLVTTEGLNYILDAALSGGTPITSWYVTAFKNNVSPAANWAAANFDSTADEIDATDVTASTRQAWTDAGVSAGQVDNYAAKSEYTVLAATLDLYGVAFLSGSAFGGTTGKVVAATAFGAVRSLVADDVFGIGYRFVATSA